MTDAIAPISLLKATTAYNPDSENFSNKHKLEFAELNNVDDETSAIKEAYKAKPRSTKERA
ncbi:MAG: hypothetical protein HQK67_11580 [Desulfamplus sp.]|nr:hypothetical protein [Desulfamplus sp.]